MKAAISLLADNQVQNFVRRMVFELEQAAQVNFLAYQAKQITLFYSPDHQQSFIC